MAAPKEPRKMTGRLRWMRRKVSSDARLLLALGAIERTATRYGLSAEDLSNITYVVKQALSWKHYRADQVRQD